MPIPSSPSITIVEPRPSGEKSLERLVDRGALRLAADEIAVGHLGRAETEQPVHPRRLGAVLEREGPVTFDFERERCRTERVLVDQDAAFAGSAKT